MYKFVIIIVHFLVVITTIFPLRCVAGLGHNTPISGNSLNSTFECQNWTTSTLVVVCT